MNRNAHIRQFGDGSLERRVQEYQSALAGYENVLRSKKLANDPKWSDALGEAEDIAVAEQVLETSLSRATNSIDLSEIDEIVEQGWMTRSQADALTKEKQKQDFKAKLQSSRQSNSNEDEQQM